MAIAKDRLLPVSAPQHPLFIYGTLMAGLALQHEMAGGVHLGAACVRGRLWDVGAFPALVAGEGEVAGEIYLVSDAHLQRLDAVEDVIPHDPAASLYLRAPFLVTQGICCGQTVEAYRYNQSTTGLTPIPHGDYRRYVRELQQQPPPL